MKYVCPGEGRTKLGNLRYLDLLTPMARNNRKKITETEELMWNLVRRKRLGWKFIKQKPIGRFVLDFYCSKLMLAIEIDGGYHERRKNYDNGRDELLFTRGIITVRYKSEDVFDNIGKIEDNLKSVISKRMNELK